jgi:hypothetical protein
MSRRYDSPAIDDRVFRRASTTGIHTFCRILHTSMGGRIPDEVP